MFFHQQITIYIILTNIIFIFTLTYSTIILILRPQTKGTIYRDYIHKIPKIHTYTHK